MSTQQRPATYTGGTGFPGLLTLVFIVLKLTGVISWSWWWVLSPLWISFSLFLVLLVVLFAIEWRRDGRK